MCFQLLILLIRPTIKKKASMPFSPKLSLKNPLQQLNSNLHRTNASFMLRRMMGPYSLPGLLILSRRTSPTLRCFKPWLCSLWHCVPFPEPGPPRTKSTEIWVVQSDWSGSDVNLGRVIVKITRNLGDRRLRCSMGSGSGVADVLFKEI